MTLQIILGAICAALLILASREIYPNKTITVWQNGLLIAVIIYVGFALFGKNWEWLPVEVGGVFIYGGLVFLSKKYSIWFLAFGWAAHVLWDLILHQNGHPGYVPDWYPGACLGFDLVIAVYIVWYFLKTKPLSKQSIMKT